MNRALESSALFGIGIGVVVTVAVQSSSITTSLLVPLCAAGVMTLESAFPIMLGANIGTTVTALLASMAQDNPAALTIALVHLLFNVFGVTIIYPIPWVRRIPIRLATGLAGAASRNRIWVLVYVVGTFVILPLTGWLLWRGLQWFQERVSKLRALLLDGSTDFVELAGSMNDYGYIHEEQVVVSLMADKDPAARAAAREVYNICQYPLCSFQS